MRFHLPAGGGGGRKSSSRRIKHKQHQAMRLRRKAKGVDSQIFRLLKHKQRLLRLADKLDQDCEVPEYTLKSTLSTEVTKVGFE